MHNASKDARVHSEESSRPLPKNSAEREHSKGATKTF